jgi:hypothetical protein
MEVITHPAFLGRPGSMSDTVIAKELFPRRDASGWLEVNSRQFLRGIV